MTPMEQLEILEKIASRPYTITGASDWPAVVAIGSLLVLAISGMWADIRYVVKTIRVEAAQNLREHKDEDDKAHCAIWASHRDCREDCCDLRKNKSTRQTKNRMAGL